MPGGEWQDSEILVAEHACLIVTIFVERASRFYRSPLIIKMKVMKELGIVMNHCLRFI